MPNPCHKTSPEMNHKNKNSRNKFQNNLKDNNDKKIVTMCRSESILYIYIYIYEERKRVKKLPKSR